MKKSLLLFFIIPVSSLVYGQALLESNSIKSKKREVDINPYLLKYQSSLQEIQLSNLEDPLNLSDSNKVLLNNLYSEKLKNNKNSLEIKKITEKIASLNAFVLGTLNKNKSLRLKEAESSFTIIEKNLKRLFSQYYRIEYRLYNTPFLIDSSKSFEEKKNIIADSLTKLYVDNSMSYHMLENTSVEISALSMIINSIKQFEFSKSDNLLKKESYLDSLFNKEKEQIKKIQASSFFLDSTFTSISATWDNNIVKLIKRKEDEKPKETDLGALPGLSSIIGQREVNLNLSILGFQKINSEKNSVYGEIRLFTSGIKTDSVQNLRTLFLPEASAFGVSGKINIGLGIIGKDSTSKRFGFNLEFNLLGKKLKPDNSTTENSFAPLVFHSKTGLEFIALKNILSLYANVNTLTTLDNVKNYKTRLNTEKLFRGFIDFGARMLLAPTDNGIGKLGLKIKIDLGFIANGGDVKSIVNSDDLVIPTFRFGLQKDFKL